MNERYKIVITAGENGATTGNEVLQAPFNGL